MEAEKYKLCLYIAGKTQKGPTIAIEKFEKNNCEEELKDKYTVEIIDLLEHPHLAEGEQIIAVPTLVKKLTCAGPCASWRSI